MLKTGKIIVEKQLDIVNASVLANYSTYLKEEYDIYAYCIDDATLEENIISNLENNLINLKLYNFNIENITIKKEYPITDTNILNKQINNVMQDSIYKTIVKEIYDRLYEIQSIGDTIDLLNYKMKIDKIIKIVNEKSQLLEDLISGRNKDVYINMLGENLGISNAVNEFYNIYEQIQDINEKIRVLKQQKDESIYEVELLLQDKGYLKEKIVEVYEIGIDSVISLLIKTNQQALNCIEEILLNTEELFVLSNLLETKIRSIDNCPEYIKEMLVLCTNTIKSVERALVKESIDQLQFEIEKNIYSLSNVSSILSKAFINVLEENNLVKTDLRNYFDEYNSTLEFTSFDNAVYGKEKDNRSFFENLGEEVLNEQLGEDIVISKNIILPSKSNKVINEVFDIDVSNDSTDDVEYKLNSFKGMINGIKDTLEEELYLNEYILLKFSNHISKSKILEQSFFKDEVEYILFGSNKQNSNIIFTKSSLMFMRFALNTIHVYSDGEKQTKANLIATTIAGWWTFGAGIPVISNLVLCAWAVAEAGLDVRALANGNDLAIYKLKGDWVLDIGLNKVVNKTPDVLKINYEDYLRLFLLSQNKKEKLLRILDLIYINSPGRFDLYNSFCKIKIEVTISQKSLIKKEHVYEIEKTLEY